MPLRPTEDVIAVNWFFIEIFNARGKQPYYNSSMSDLAITSNTVAEFAACGCARWKIENETFNLLKADGYNLRYNFGHGKRALGSVLVTLNLLAFAFHTLACFGIPAWRAAVIARGPTHRGYVERLKKHNHPCLRLTPLGTAMSSIGISRSHGGYGRWK